MKSKYIFGIALSLFIGIAVTSCTDGNDWGTDSTHDRLFSLSSSKIEVEAADITAEVSFQRMPEIQYYIIELSTDTLYDDIPLGSTANSIIYGQDKSITSSPVTLTNLMGDTRYYMRIKGMSDVKAESRWTYYKDGKTFKTLAEQIFNTLTAEDILNGSVHVSWDTSKEADHIVVRIGEEEVQYITLTDADKAAGELIINNLNPTTTYTISIYNGNAKRGTLTVTTPSAIPTSNYNYQLPADATVITQNMMNEIAEQAKAEAGSETNYSVTIEIPANKTIDIHGTAEDGSATSVKVPDGMSVTFFGLAGGERPVINLSKSLDIRGSHAFIRFENVEIVDGGCLYVINQSETCTLGELSFNDIRSNGLSRSLVRLQGDAAKSIEKLIINNSIISNQGQGGYALIQTYNGKASKINEISVSNSTFYTLQHSFISGANSLGYDLVDIKDCTFYNIIGSGRYLVDANSLDTNISMTNDIFALVYNASAKGIRTAGTVEISNSYSTNDFILSSNKFTTDQSFDGSSADLFKAPENADFTLRTSIEAGDPRWYPTE